MDANTASHISYRRTWVPLLGQNRNSGPDHRHRSAGSPESACVWAGQHRSELMAKAGIEPMSTIDKTRTILTARARPPATMALEWSDGHARRTRSGQLLRGKSFRSLRDPAEFSRVHVGEWGIRWMAVRRGTERRIPVVGNADRDRSAGHARIPGMAAAARPVR